MAGSITFSMIKPGATSRKQTGMILAQIEAASFTIKALKKTRFTKEQACRFYSVHNDKPFFEDLIAYMISGPIYAFVLEKENAVLDYRKLIGSTNHLEAEEGTIRKKFATSVQDNAVHGADSDDNAMLEASFFFSEFERY